MAVILVIPWNLQYMIRKVPGAGGIYTFERQAGGKDLGFLAFWFILLTYLAILWANITSLPLFARFFLGDAFRFGFHYNLFGYEVWLGEAHFVEMDRIALSMDKPCIFVEDVSDGAGHMRHLQTTKLQFIDSSGRKCLLGMCLDMTSAEMIRHAEELMEEEQIALGRISALAGDYLSVHIVDPETERYREFSSSTGFESFSLPKEGEDFFNTTREMSPRFVYPEDLERYMNAFTRENVLKEIERNGIFTLTYRLLVHGEPVYVQLKAARVDEKDGPRIIVGLNDIDVQIRQEEQYRKRLAYAQAQATIDALTGIKNKQAYQAAESNLDRQIKDGGCPAFAVSILDVNDLKKVNDTEGHQAGDQLIRTACRIVCTTFKHSPVFRVGGDEFAVISQGNDLEQMNGLVGLIADRNEQALRTGGIVIACGTARYEKGKDTCVASVFERADQLMYENKARLKAEGPMQE